MSKFSSKRRSIRIATAMLGIATIPKWLGAQPSKYPSSTIKVIVPFAAGGTLDVAVRPLTQVMGESMGQNFVVDNRAGANGVIGTDLVAKAAPDGYTLLAVTASFVLNPSMYKGISYDVIKDFTPIAGLMQGVGFVMAIHPSLPVNTVQEFIAYEKKSSKPIAYSTPGVGNTIHIASELFNQRAGTQMLHIPYKGSAPSLNALVAGEVQVAIMPPAIVMPFIKSGKLKAIAFTGSKRLSDLPDVPIMSEVGVQDMIFQGTWMGLFGPAGLSKNVVDRLYNEVVKALAQPTLRQNLATGVVGYVPDGSPPEQFSKQVRDDVKRYSEILQKLNIQPS